MNSYIRRLFARSVTPSPVGTVRRPRPAAGPRTARLLVEWLENRVVPSAPPAPAGFTSTTTPFNNTTAVAIPGGPAVVSSTINVSGVGGYLHDLDLTTFITHTWNADLDITLKSPSGTVVTITTDNGGSNDNVFNGTLWDDDADPGNEAPYASPLAASKLVTDTAYANATVETALVPEEPLAAFRGENPNGDWTLVISDAAAGDSGNLASWKLDITTLNSAVTEAPVATFTNSTALAIPGGPAVVSSTITVSGAPAYLNRLTLQTFITHTWNADLDITLKSPSGTVVTITTDNGGSNDNVFNGTLWDDDADPGNEAPYASPLAASKLVTDTAYANATVETALTPEEAFGAFIGENPNGDWTLVISDAAAGDSGNLASWKLNVYGVSAGDTTQPTVTVNQATTQADPTSTGPIAFTVVFSEAINASTFTAGDIKFTGSTAPGVLVAAISGTGPTYTVSVSGMTGTGTVVASIDAGSVADPAGNTNKASTSTDNTVTFDNESPTVTVNQALGQADPTNGSSIQFTVVFSEAINASTFTAGDIKFTGSTAGGTLVAAISGTGPTYTVTVTGMTSSGTVVASLAGSTVADLAGNLNVPSTSTDNTVTYDVTAPTVTVNQAGGQPDPTNVGPIAFTVVFGEPINPASFTGSDFSFAGSTVGGTLSASISGTGPAYTVTVSGMTGNGLVRLSLPAGAVADPAGNTNPNSTSTDNTVTFDTAGPAVTVNQAATQSDPTNGPMQFTVVFGEPINPASFTGSDFSFAGSTAGGTLSAGISGTGPTYTVTVSGMTTPGDVVVTLPAGGVADLAGNFNNPSTSTDNSVTFDDTPPTVTINQAPTQADPAYLEPYHFVVAFSEAVTGFDKNDIILSGTALPQDVSVVATADPLVYDVFVTNTQVAGTVIADVAAGGAFDLAGNGNLVSTSDDNVITGDTAPPIITINQAAGQADPTNAGPILFTVTFNEPIDPTTFTASDISFAGSTVGGPLSASISPTPSAGVQTYTVTVTGMTGTGVVVASIPAGRLTDVIGNVNENSVSTDNEVTFDTVPATVTVEQATGQADPTNGSFIYFTVEFDEAVTGFDTPATDVVISGTAGGTLSATILPLSATTYTVRVTGMTSTGTVVVDIPAGAAVDQVLQPSDPSTSTDNEVTFDNEPPDTAFDVTPPEDSPLADVTFTFTGDDNISLPTALTFEYQLDGGGFVSTLSTLALFGLADGSHTIEVRATDEAGNTDASPAVYTFRVDTAAPTVTLSSSAPDPTNTSPIPFTATFSETVTTFALTDIQVTNGTATAFAGTGSVYTFLVIPDGDSLVTVLIADGVAPDAAGNPNSGDSLSRVYDATRPTITITSTAPNPTNTSPIPVTVTFSEPVFTFDESDITKFGNWTLANFTVVSPTVYTFEMFPSGEGEVSLLVLSGAAPDPAGNANVQSAVFSRVYDTVRPTVTVNQASGQADPINRGPILFTVVFSEPVTGFTSADVVLGGTAGATTATVSGSGTTYTVAVTGMTQFGTVTVDIADAAAIDAATNPTLGSTSTDNSVLYDPIVPTVTITPAGGQRDPVTIGPIVFTVTFSKPVTGFTAADLSLAQSTAGGNLTATVTGSGAVYTVTVDGMTTPGDVTLSFGAGAATDAAESGSLAPAGGDPTVTYAGEIFAVGAANGGAPRVDVFNGTGRLLYSFFAYDGSFRGGVKVAVGDVTGDGIPDIVTGAGFGGSPHVKVFDGRNAALVASFFAYDDSARGGVFVAVGDVTGDGRPDIITGAGPTGAPHVGIFDGTTLTNVKSFFAFSETFRDGVTVAAGDVNGDGRADVVTGNGTTGEIQVYDGVSGASLRRIAPFYSPADSVLPLGVNMAVGDVTGDGIPDVVIGAGEGGGPLVQVYDGSTAALTLKNGAFAFDPSFRRGVTLAIRDMTGDGVGEILAGSGDNGDVAVLDGDSLTQLSLLDPFGPAYAGGVFVG